MCCGSGGNRKLRSQQVVQKASKPRKVAQIQRVKRKQTAERSVSIERQYVVPHARCSKCGYPTMLVNIAGRERQQCSNANCRQILK